MMVRYEIQWRKSKYHKWKTWLLMSSRKVILTDKALMDTYIVDIRNAPPTGWLFRVREVKDGD